MTGEVLKERLMRRGLLQQVEKIAIVHATTIHEIASSSRMAHVARARHETMRLLRAKGLSYPAIGLIMDRDHTTVMAALRRKL